MMIRKTLLLVCLCAPGAVHAQVPVASEAPDSAAAPRIGPAIQRIESASAVSTERLGTIMSVLELPDGRVLVNDGPRRRLLLMDTTLQQVQVVLDSATHIANTYGTRPGELLPYRADSVLFVDPASFAAIVISPEGDVTRVRSVWRVEDMPWVSSAGYYGWPGLDARGRIVYRVPAQPAPPLVRPPSGVPYFPQQPDSAFIVAVDPDTRRLDTLGSIRIPKQEMRIRRTPQGSYMFDPVINPLPVTDDWAVLSDGRVAFVRALDYRIEYLSVDGTITSSPKLPYDWQRLTEEDRQRMVDSVRTAQQRTASLQYVTSMIRWVNQYRQQYPPNFTVPAGYILPPGMPRDWQLPPGMNFPDGYAFACGPDEKPAQPSAAPVMMVAGPPGAGGAPGAPGCMPAPTFISSGPVPQPPPMRQVHVMPADELPEYKPPIPSNAVRADRDGNLWIRTNPPQPVAGGPVYDVVDGSGDLTTRIQLPQGYSIAGFGRGKVVFLSMRDATGLHLARVRLR